MLVKGAVHSLDFTVDSKVVIGSLTVTRKSLRATDTDAQGDYRRLLGLQLHAAE